MLLSNLRRILNLGDKKDLRKSGPASWKDEQNLPVPLGNEEEHWKRLLTFQGPSLPSALSFSITSWSGTAWSIVLEIINESNLFSASFERLRDYSCFEVSRNSRKPYPKLFPKGILTQETISRDAHSSITSRKCHLKVVKTQHRREKSEIYQDAIDTSILVENPISVEAGRK